MNMSGTTAPRPPRWYGVLLRAGAITFLGTLLTFTVSLFLSIIGTFLLAAVRGRRPNMPFAYRHIAVPVAIAAGCILLVASLIYEIRQYRQSRALAAIARIS
jgi:hypothetical protein